MDSTPWTRQGVATEVGGILSHAAVIGREYGIPAVLNIPNLTKKFKQVIKFILMALMEKSSSSATRKSFPFNNSSAFF